MIGALYKNKHDVLVLREKVANIFDVFGVRQRQTLYHFYIRVL